MLTRESIFLSLQSNDSTIVNMFPNFCVLRYKNNEELDDLAIGVSKDKREIEGSEETEVIDVKIEPSLLGMLIQREVFL